MPPKGYSIVTVREDVKKRLDDIAYQKGFSSLNDVITFLIDRYNEYTAIYSKITDLITRLEDLRCLGEELYTRLEKLKTKLGYTNIFETIKFLLDTYETNHLHQHF